MLALANCPIDRMKNCFAVGDVGNVTEFERGSFLVPLRNGELFRWCLTAGFRVAAPQTLMSLGFYQEPAGAFLPSILY